MKLPQLACNLFLGAMIATFPIAMTAQTTNSSNPSATQSGMANSTMNSGQSSKTLDAMDRSFVNQAAEGGLAEVELGKMAETKAANPQVKQFAERMVHDHTQANDQLKQVASDESIQLPDHISQKDRMLKARLSKLSGDQFDKVYMQNMVKDHQKDVAQFKRESKDAQNPAVRNFAQKTTPILESHLSEAEQIAPKVEANMGQPPMTK